MLVQAGATDVTTYFQLRTTAGADATGLTIADFDMQYVRTGATPAAKVDAVALAAANTAHTDNRGIEVDATDTPGLYRFDWPDAAFASGVREAILTIKHASILTESLRVQITGFDAADGVRMGLTALPNAAADAAGGLPISDAGGLDLDAKIGALTFGTANRVNAQVFGMEANTMTAAAAAADLTTELQNGLATAANLATVAGFLDTEIAAILAAVDTEIGTILSGLTTIEGKIDTVDNLLDTEVAAIKTVVDAILVDTGTDGVVVASIAANAITASAIADNAIDAGAIASNAITAAKIADNAITSAKIAGDAIGATQLADGALTANKIASDALTSAKFDSTVGAEFAAALLDLAAGVETGLTVRQYCRLTAAVQLGKASGLETTSAIYRDFGDTKDRITATVDSNGNRTAVTRDAT